MGDNVGQRGLKHMLGGTELNLKKEKNQMEELVREDWMSKPFELPACAMVPTAS